MRPVRAAWRLLRLIGHLLRGIWTIRSQFGRLAPSESALLVRAWSRRALDIAGIGLVVQGHPPLTGPVLVVANHISWLDILVINAARPCRFVSKADVREWPVLGTLVAGAGTLFIERERRRDAMRVVHHLAEQLREGEVLAVFPEGTTSDGDTVLPFHANLLQAAIATGAPVLPLVLRYADARSGQPSLAPSYAGETTLLQSVWRTLMADALQAQLDYGESVASHGMERRSLAQALRQDIAARLGVTLSG